MDGPRERAVLPYQHFRTVSGKVSNFVISSGEKGLHLYI